MTFCSGRTQLARTLMLSITAFLGLPVFSAEPVVLPTRDESWNLVWSDEFNQDGKPDTQNWRYEVGFQRNNEAQWYQTENAYCQNGQLILEARQESKELPESRRPSRNRWSRNRTSIEYTSASLISFFSTVNCLRVFDLISSFHCSGTIGRCAIDHFLNSGL